MSDPSASVASPGWPHEVRAPGAPDWEATAAAARRGLSETRTDLRGLVHPDAVEAAVQTWFAEDARLVGVRRAVGLVEEALLGRRFRPRL